MRHDDDISDFTFNTFFNVIIFIALFLVLAILIIASIFIKCVL